MANPTVNSFHGPVPTYSSPCHLSEYKSGRSFSPCEGRGILAFEGGFVEGGATDDDDEGDDDDDDIIITFVI